MELVEGEFHEGEKWMQEKVFGAKPAEQHRTSIRAFIRLFMPEQHQVFFQENPWLVVGTVDNDGYPRASILVQPQFKSLKRGRGFRMTDIEHAQFRGDKVVENLASPGSSLGILGIQFTTRRRNRVNATVINLSKASGETDFMFKVEQSFGNCPKYIQARGLRLLENDSAVLEKEWGAYRVEEGTNLEGQALKILEKTDTFFIATAKRSDVSGARNEEKNDKDLDEYGTWKVPDKMDSSGVDVSHRGGSSGFVQVEAGGASFRWPDFVGNGMFNTLGNIVMEPRVSILVIDFKTGALLQIRGDAKVQLDDNSLPGGARTVEVHVKSYKLTYGALRLVFDEIADQSPFNPVLSGGGDDLRFLGAITETHDSKSFFLQSKRPLIIHPGQYGNFRILRNGKELATRAWTISSTSSDTVQGIQEFCITVKLKKGGKVSPVLHSGLESLAKGEIKLELLGVSGDFVLPEDYEKTKDRFAFIVAGSGVTPAMSMLRKLSQRGVPATIIYSVQERNDIIFEDELRSLSQLKTKVYINFTRAKKIHDEKASGKFVFNLGRISEELLKSSLDEEHYTAAFICGPGGFARLAQDVLNRSFENISTIKLESYDF